MEGQRTLVQVDSSTERQTVWSIVTLTTTSIDTITIERLINIINIITIRRQRERGGRDYQRSRGYEERGSREKWIHTGPIEDNWKL